MADTWAKDDIPVPSVPTTGERRKREEEEEKDEEEDEDWNEEDRILLGIPRVTKEEEDKKLKGVKKQRVE